MPHLAGKGMFRRPDLLSSGVIVRSGEKDIDFVVLVYVTPIPKTQTKVGGVVVK